ncbi:hypothetical protein FJZ17_01580 [Candidatus Pacearchaeota archaeon]|nr:hypothetical protein [Candidatus Pacearchaeota archaeon]
MEKRGKGYRKPISFADKKKKSFLPFWYTLLAMFVVGFIYGFASIRCECSSKIGCQNCSYLEAALLSAIFFVIISLIPTLIAFFILKRKNKLI